MAIINNGTDLPKKIEEKVVCVGVEDLGMNETSWGPRRQIEFVFESQQTRDNGYRLNRRQRCNLSFHEMAALPKFLESWLGRKLEQHEQCLGFALQQKGRQAELTLKPAEVGNRTYWNIIEIRPSTGNPVVPSGEYRTRKQWDEYRRSLEVAA